jgi:hypothetical protein
MSKISDSRGLFVGQQFVLNHNNSHRANEDVFISKIGTKYVTLSLDLKNPNSARDYLVKISSISFSFLRGLISIACQESNARVHFSRATFQALQEKAVSWGKLRRLVGNSHQIPEHLTTEGIDAIIDTLTPPFFEAMNNHQSKPLGKSIGFMLLAKRPCGKVVAAAWEPENAETTAAWRARGDTVTAAWRARGDTVERVQRFENDDAPVWTDFNCRACNGECKKPSETETQ